MTRPNVQEAATARALATSNADGPAFLGEAVRRALVRQAAYFRSERRGFAPGRELEDWLEAEQEIDRSLAPRSQQPRGL